MLIRDEIVSDIVAVRKVHELAFNSPSEALLVDLLRARGKATISLVAKDDGEILGHVLFSPVTIDPASPGWNALGLAPVGVMHGRQSKGIGKDLIRQGLERCRSGGSMAVVVLGDPDYYTQFGFERTNGLTQLSAQAIDVVVAAGTAQMSGHCQERCGRRENRVCPRGGKLSRCASALTTRRGWRHVDVASAPARRRLDDGSITRRKRIVVTHDVIYEWPRARVSDPEKRGPGAWPVRPSF